MDKGREHKPHIGIFGRRNFGKSSLINSLTGQDVSIVSEQPGTTTDPVKKSIEIEGVGPAIIIDTAGIDDTGSLGELRVKKTKEVMQIIDLALLLVNGNASGSFEEELTESFYDSGVPFLFVHNKSDLVPLDPDFKSKLEQLYKVPVIEFSSVDNRNLKELVGTIKKTMPETAWRKQSLLGDLVNYGDIVLLITPVDTEAPEGRLILPQVQAIRDVLDNDCIAVVLKERELDTFLKRTAVKPKLAVCDTSVILKADASVPDNIPLTGFSILLARYKGDFEHYLDGTPAISDLKDGDRVLMLESCTHHVSCDDIGRMKIPRWMSSFTGRKLDFDVVSGLNHITRPITDYALVVQCGGCMITRKQLVNRLKPAIDAGIPVTNYGMAIAYMQGVYERAIAPFQPASFRGSNL
ncbi:MAG TPA: [FeFe] hydrogenase H-cluster maturation GTPase HydF [Bacteroidales bacterium]|nr:[FeFe] hydrogenase H-cluster maturation GTPase HydF [Bacteroidales bacterium]